MDNMKLDQKFLKTVKPYRTVGYKTLRTKLSIVFLWITLIFLFNYIFFIQRNLWLLIALWIVAYWFFKLLNTTKSVLYEFDLDKVVIHYWKNKKFVIKKDEIWRVRKIMRVSNYVWINEEQNIITREIYFTTSKQNMICFYLRDKRNIIISPRIIKPRILKYYDSERLIDRF